MEDGFVRAQRVPDTSTDAYEALFGALSLSADARLHRVNGGAPEDFVEPACRGAFVTYKCALDAFDVPAESDRALFLEFLDGTIIVVHYFVTADVVLQSGADVATMYRADLRESPFVEGEQKSAA